MDNAIVTTVTANPVIVLTDEKIYSSFYEQMKAEIDGFEPDLTTDAGRKKIAALAYKVTRTKTAIDAAGKKLNEDARAQINAVDSQRRKIRDELDQLAEQARKPLTDWEKAEEVRVADIKARIAHIEACGAGLIGGELQPYVILLRELEEKIVVDSSYGEFEQQARLSHQTALTRVKEAFEAHQKAEADRAELERLRTENAEREQREQEAAAAAEAERLKVEAAQAEATQIDAEKAQAARREQEAAESAREEERQRAQKAIDDANERARKVEMEAQAERDRAAAEQKRLADEQDARNANKAHRSKLMKEAKEAVMSLGCTDDTARAIILAIVAGEIPHVRLKF